ncbi:MAG: MATE family efflux transporter [Saprospiraceae bacterium]|jgi:putative MATE family efflux protein|nr:MATE family efflux transporter [Saprospiraceae bacterium]MBK6478396.1 MATE family efflux transporter [Saprospiraceae bacterium]MBK7436758.1 MATE family efflux transporter [Saprospiraceae bacterium]MBK7608215.1 MATE family efflux transporter [Saprospiraceae bacterium]MBK8511530.1 MATE family efflux transporter [Saprospiraceae bacterium]
MSTLQIKTSFADIFRFALPISVSILIPQVNFITNNVFLSRLGETELGTAGITGVYYLIFTVIGFGFNNGLQSLMSRSAGGGNQAEIGRYLAQAIKVICFLSIAGVVFTYLFAPYIMKSQLQNGEVLDLAVSFVKIRILGLPFLFLYQIGNSFLISTNNTRFLMIGSIAEAATNIILDYILIFGHFGFRPMGFEGAAWASIIAEAVGMVVVHSFLWYKKLPQEFRVLSYRGWDRSATYNIFDRSAPLIFQYLISIVSWFLFYLWIEDLGPRALAISNTMRNVFGVIGVFIWAFAATSNNMVSNIIGQGHLDQVIPLIKRIASLSFFLVLPCCIALNLFPEVFFKLYSASDAFNHEAIPVIRVVTVAILIMSQGSIWLNAILGTGLTRINLAIEFVTVGVYVLYTYTVIKIKHLSLPWAWGSEFFYWSILWFGSWLFFRFFPWRERYKR